MARENLVFNSLRLNMNNPQHVKINEILCSIDKDVCKSKNQFIVDALDFYIRSFEEEDLVKNATMTRAKKQGWVSRDDFETFKAEMKIEIRNEMIQLLGSLIAGKQINVAQTVNEGVAISQSKGVEHGDGEEIVGMTDPDAISLISSWG